MFLYFFILLIFKIIICNNHNEFILITIAYTMKTKKHIKYIIFLYFSIFKNNVIINSQQISLDDKKKELTTIVKEINDIPKQVRRDQREQFATSNTRIRNVLLR